jgi:hypothetical protein
MADLGDLVDLERQRFMVSLESRGCGKEMENDLKGSLMKSCPWKVGQS